jgi:uncharacterized membrane protein
MPEPSVTTSHEEPDHGCRCRGDGKSGRAILDRRYARGELTREQYQQMKQDLVGDEKGEKSCC